MKVAIHINRSFYRIPQNKIENTIRTIAVTHPEIEFVFISDDSSQVQGHSTPNCSDLYCGPKISHPLTLRFWYQFRLPAILKKIKADYFISTAPICAISTDVPQAITLPGYGCIDARFDKHYRKKHDNYIKKSALLIETNRNIDESPATKPQVHLYSLPDEKFHTLEEIKREEIKSILSNGVEYFIYIGTGKTDPGFMIALKAFSIFKKWQLSEMRLLLTTQSGELPQIPELSNYRHKEDVLIHIPDSRIRYPDMLGAAFAGISFYTAGDEDPALQLMKCGVPVISAKNKTVRESMGANYLPANFNDSDLSQKMILIYKDEQLKNELKLKGMEFVAQLSNEKNAESLLKAISAHN